VGPDFMVEELILHLQRMQCALQLLWQLCHPIWHNSNIYFSEISPGTVISLWFQTGITSSIRSVVGEALKDNVCIHWKNACSFETFAYGLNLKWGHPGGPEQWEEVSLFNGQEALALVNEVFKFLRIGTWKRRKQHHI
jgi:hypothetical protein